MDINLKEAEDAVLHLLPKKLVPILLSAPGIGKSDTMRAVAEKLNLELIDVRLAQREPTDLLGMPSVDSESKTSEYLPFRKDFPLEDQEVPEGKEGWLLFLDEIRNADIHVQHAAYRLVLDRQVGGYNLHPKCYIVAAGNREVDNTFVTPMASALKSRLIHLNIRLDFKLWMNYVMSNNFDSRIISYLNYKPGNLMPDKAWTEDNPGSFACPRTWAFVNKIISGVEDITQPFIKALIAGATNDGVAEEFLSYIKFYEKVPKFEDILNNPDKAPVPGATELGIMWATVGSLIDKTTLENMEPIIQYVLRMPTEFQVVYLESVRKRDAEYSKFQTRLIQSKFPKLFETLRKFFI